MKNFWGRIWDVLSGAPRRQRKRDLWRVANVAELPEGLKNRRLYLIGADTPWSAALNCPCGCGAVIQLSLLQSDSPSWRVSVEKGQIPDLTPSVWRTKGCRSHFFLRHGEIIWCRPDGREWHERSLRV